MDQKQICKEVDTWITEEELPARLKPIRMFDGLYPEDEEEREAYFDFINWHLSQDWKLLDLIPNDNNEDYFHNPIVAGEDSAFNTIDYHRKNSYSFNSYHYRLRKVYERIKDLAILHSSVSSEDGKKNIRTRYDNLLDDEFRTERDTILKTLKENRQVMDRKKAITRLSELNIRINKGYSIWNQYAFWE